MTADYRFLDRKLAAGEIDALDAEIEVAKREIRSDYMRARREMLKGFPNTPVAAPEPEIIYGDELPRRWFR